MKSTCITFKVKGDLKKTYKFLRFLSSRAYLKKIEKYAKIGVQALSDSTPIDSGLTSISWGYKIEITKEYTKVIFTNDNVTEEGTPVAILLQYGHATRHGGYVEGYDYINPAIRPVFQRMADDMWREVQTA